MSYDDAQRSKKDSIYKYIRVKRILLIIVFGALVYAVLGTIGENIEKHGELIFGEWRYIFLRRYVFSFFILTIIILAFPSFLKICRRFIPDDDQIVFPWYRVFFALMISWIPMFLIEFPGSFMYDTQRQAFQIATGQYDAFHPLLHTLILRCCLSLYPMLQSIEKCAACYSILQMVLLAYCFAQTCTVLNQIVKNRYVVLMCTIFYALYPAHMAMACNYIKDVPFSGLFSLYVALILKQTLIKDRERQPLAINMICGSLVCLLRNNMVYAMALWAVFLFLTKHKRIFLSVVLSIFIACGANEAMIHALQAERGSIVEMLSIPIQQISRARLLAPESFSEKEKDILNTVIAHDAWNNYEPSLSDPVKANVSKEKLIENKAALLRLWFTIGLRNPKIYCDAVFNLILPSIYPYRTYSVAQPYIEIGIQPGVLTAPFGQAPMKQPSRFEKARNWLNSAIYSTGANCIPVLRWMMNTGMIYWLLLLCLLLVFAYHGSSYYALLLPVCLYGTYLLGPVMQGRYLYPFVCVIPHFLMSTVIAAIGRKEYA